jgi:cytochrome c oxidase subunit 4
MTEDPSAGNPSGVVASFHVHVASARMLVTVCVLLLLLTALTIVAAGQDTGSWEIWIAIGIATLKATLVAMYFMHLRYDKSFHSLVFLVAIACLGLFLTFTLADAETYRANLRSPPATAGGPFGPKLAP